MPLELAEEICAPFWRAVPVKGRVRVVRAERPLMCDVSSLARGESVYECAAGLGPVVTRHLQRAGVEVKFNGHWIATLPAMRSLQMGGGPRDHSLLAAINSRSHLQLRHSPAVRPEDLAVMIGRAWPSLRLVVGVARVDEARGLADALRGAGVHAALASHRHIPREDARVVVSTYGQLGRASIGIHDLDFLILADAVEALGIRPREFLDPTYWAGSVRVPRVIGMVPTGRRLAPSDRIGLIELCGPYAYDLAALGMVARPVTYSMTKVCGGRIVSTLRQFGRRRRRPGQHVERGQQPISDPSVVDLLRAGIWRHPIRNRRLTRLARLVEAGDRATLAADFPDVAAVDDLQLPAAVAVVVHGREHAHVLAARLPGWSVIDRGPAQAPGTNSEDRARGVIVTLDGLRDLLAFDAGVIIRADGGTGGLTLPPASMVGPPAVPPRPLLVVDCADRHHPELRRRARARQAAYRDAGWLLAGQDEVDVALDLILQRGRP
jgi:hypothetical protein